MIFALVRYVAARHLVSAKLRTLLTVFGVALGVAMVVGTTAANNAILHAFDELADRAAGKADFEVVGDETGVDQAVVSELADATQSVAHAAGRIEQTTVIVEADGTAGARVLVLGVDFLGDLTFIPFARTAGADPFRDALALVNDPHAIVVSETLAAARGMQVGSALSLRTARGNETFHVEAIVRDTGSSRAFGGQVVILSLDAAQLAFQRDGRVDRIDVALPAGVPSDRGRAELATLVGSRGAVGRPSQRAASLARMTAAFSGGLQVTAIIAVLVGLFLVYNAIAVAVSQRRHEIGVLRALGASRRSIVVLFVAEAALLGAIGGALGVVLGAGLAKSVISQFAPNVSRFFENIATPPVPIGRALIARGIALGVLASMFAALGPARRAATVPPIESVRRGPEVASRARRRKGALALGALLLCAFAAVVIAKPTSQSGLLSLLAIFLAAVALAPLTIAFLADRLGPPMQALAGVAVRLGVEGVGRALGRSAQTVAALTIATALGLTISAYTYSYERTCLAWIEQAVPADVVVSVGSPLLDRHALAFDPAAKDALAKADTVSATNLVRAISVPYGALRVEVVSLETDTYLARLGEARQVVRGPRQLGSMTDEPTILISENFAWKTGLGPGGRVELGSPTGPHWFRILAVVVDYSNDQGWMLIDRKWALEFWRDARVEMIHVYLKPGVDPLVAATQLRAAVGPGYFVTTNATMKAEIRKVIEQTFGISRAAETVALIVAVLGVVGTMIATVIDRRREIGVLRAIGATRRQITVAVAVEAAMLGACASVLAVLASIPASKIFVDVVAFQSSGWSVPLRFPVAAYARVVLSVIVLAALAGAIPGFRAARTPLTRALV